MLDALSSTFVLILFALPPPPLFLLSLLDGGKARECAKRLDAAAAAAATAAARVGAAVVVVGLVGIAVREEAPKGCAAMVWDPKEEATLLVNPDHPAARALHDP